MRKLLIVFLLWCVLPCGSVAQHMYYRSPDSVVLRQFTDTSQRVTLPDNGGVTLLSHQTAWLLRFFPNLRVKQIRIELRPAAQVARTRPRFRDILKSPDQRTYRICLSNYTGSTLDSVLYGALSLNAQLGLLAREICQVEDLSTGGFLDHMAWCIRQLSRRGRNRIFRQAETRALEVGLGYQLLALNTETTTKLNIDHWKSVKGYTQWVKFTKTPAMKPYLIHDFINDLPVYVTQTYR